MSYIITTYSTPFTYILLPLQVMQKSCRFSFMYGELTDKSTITALNNALESHEQEQYEILLYKKNRKLLGYNNIYMLIFWVQFNICKNVELM